MATARQASHPTQHVAHRHFDRKPSRAASAGAIVGVGLGIFDPIWTTALQTPISSQDADWFYDSFWTQNLRFRYNCIAEQAGQ
ncbi:MAG TPA: hypothetical protein VGS80_04840 [Ktedonobacterales bacterium]|nr:hypothetical protein [Ktedonobacterales bacterium]